MGVGEPPRGQHLAKMDRLGDAVPRAGQALGDEDQLAKLILRAEMGMVGHVIGHPGHLIEGHHHRAVTRGDEDRGDGKVLVPVTLARPLGDGARGGQAPPPCMDWAWARPFHMPPRPRQTSQADRRV